MSPMTIEKKSIAWTIWKSRHIENHSSSKIMHHLVEESYDNCSVEELKSEQLPSYIFNSFINWDSMWFLHLLIVNTSSGSNLRNYDTLWIQRFLNNIHLKYISWLLILDLHSTKELIFKIVRTLHSLGDFINYRRYEVRNVILYF